METWLLQRTQPKGNFLFRFVTCGAEPQGDFVTGFMSTDGSHVGVTSLYRLVVDRCQNSTDRDLRFL